jgi:hypothetical protein
MTPEEEIKTALKNALKSGHINTADFVTASSLVQIASELTLLNGILLQLIGSSLPPEPVAKTIKKGQAKQ